MENETTIHPPLPSLTDALLTALEMALSGDTAGLADVLVDAEMAAAVAENGAAYHRIETIRNGAFDPR